MLRVFGSVKAYSIRRTFLASKPFSEKSTEVLLRRVRACDLCAEHLPLGPRPVFQFGANAPILLVGQGTAAHNSRIPFNDPSGERLRRWLGVTPESLSDLAQDWQSRWPDVVVLPHPSPRNTRWLQQRTRVEDEIVPTVQQRVTKLLAAHPRA